MSLKDVFKRPRGSSDAEKSSAELCFKGIGHFQHMLKLFGSERFVYGDAAHSLCCALDLVQDILDELGKRLVLSEEEEVPPDDAS